MELQGEDRLEEGEHKLEEIWSKFTVFWMEAKLTYLGVLVNIFLFEEKARNSPSLLKYNLTHTENSF